MLFIPQYVTIKKIEDFKIYNYMNGSKYGKRI